MSTPFYDLASLVVVPSGYKASKVYAQKPLTTDGQLSFSRASTATRVNSAGLIETVSSNVPRLDYLGSACPKLLLEPQRSNLLVQSSAFDNASWVKNTSIVTANTAVSPSGATDADTLAEDSFTNDSASTFQVLGTSSNVAYTTSVYVKQNAGRYFFIRNYYLSGQDYYTVIVDTQTGTITKTQAGNSVSGVSSSIQSMGNGWYRVIATQTSAASTLIPVLGITNSGTATIDSFGNPLVSSSASRSLYLWGAQLEQGSYATSLINTTTAAVTRLADACSKTGISSLIGQTEGTFFIEITDWRLALDTVLIGVSDGSLNNYMQISSNGSSGDLQSVIFTAGTGGSTLGTLTPTAGQTLKIAVAYKVNDYAMYVNGVQIGTLTSKPAPTNLTRVDIGSLGWLSSGLQPRPKFAQALLFKTRLTNAQLAELTAL